MFSIAGKELAAQYSDEHAKNPDNDEFVDDLPRQGFSSQQLLLTRICFARTAAVNQDGSPESSSLNIGPANGRHDRVLAARQVILAILLAADPDANDYITPDICELARLQFETTEQGVLGRLWVLWNWKDRDRHLCPGVIRHDCPTPEALRLLDSALKLIEHGVVSTKSGSNVLISRVDYKKASWFTRATRGLLTCDTLRKAVNRKALVSSKQSIARGEWTHSVAEVCKVYPGGNRVTEGVIQIAHNSIKPMATNEDTKSELSAIGFSNEFNSCTTNAGLCKGARRSFRVSRAPLSKNGEWHGMELGAQSK